MRNLARIAPPLLSNEPRETFDKNIKHCHRKSTLIKKDNTTSNFLPLGGWGEREISKFIWTSHFLSSSPPPLIFSSSPMGPLTCGTSCYFIPLFGILFSQDFIGIRYTFVSSLKIHYFNSVKA
jgi:hypothetical protein